MFLFACLLATPALAAFQRGQAALDAHQPRLARVELMNAVAENPRDPRPRVALARVLLRLGDGPAAEAELRRAREAGARDVALRPLLAEAALLSGHPKQALNLATAGPATDRAALLRMEGRARAALGDTAGAAEAFGLALELAPRNPALWADVARFRLGTGERAGANAAAARAAELAPGDPDALTLRGVLVRDQYGHRAALPWFDRALAAQPDHRDGLLARGASYAELGRNRELLADTRAVLAFSPGDPDALLAQATVAARAGDWELANAILQRVGNRLASDPAALLLRGAVDLQIGNPRRAALTLQRLVEAQPDNGKAFRLLARARLMSGESAWAWGTLYLTTNRPDADSYSLALHARAARHVGKEAEARTLAKRASAPAGGGAPLAVPSRHDRGLAGDQVLRIRALMLDDRNGDAIGLARAVAANNPGAPLAHLALGDALALSGDHAAAAEHYRRAANILFTEPVALRLVDALGRSGQDEAAAAVLSLFAGQNPQSSRAQLAAAGAALLARDGAAAAADYEHARALWGTHDAAALLNAGWAEWAAGDRDRALTFARLAHHRAPTSLATTDGLGWMLWRSGRDRPRALLLLAAARTGRF